jgi:hypothetical protein
MVYIDANTPTDKGYCDKYINGSWTPQSWEAVYHERGTIATSGRRDIMREIAEEAQLILRRLAQ